MANPMWPSALPPFVMQQGYGEKFGEQTIESPVDAGVAKIRRRYTARNRMFTVTVLMSAAQFATFETFFEATVAGGSLPFDWVAPRTQVATTFRFRKPAPQMSMQGANSYAVQMNMERTS